MNRSYISKELLVEFLHEGMYPISEKKSEGRDMFTELENRKNLPPVSLPGGDIGDVAILLATAEIYGFEIDIIKATDLLFRVICGFEHKSNISAKTFLSVTNFLPFIKKNCLLYNLNERSITELDRVCSHYDLTVPVDTKIQAHQVQGAVILEATKALLPHITLKSEGSMFDLRLFIFHKRLVDARHKKWVELLIDEKVVELYSGLNAEYLYEVLSEVTEQFLMETIVLLDRTLPIFSAIEKKNEDFTITLL